MIWLIAALLVLIAALGAPLFAVLGALALIGFALSGQDGVAVAVEFYRLSDMPALIAIPLFTLAGYLLAESQAPRRLVRLTNALVGWLPGGLALVAATCAGFGTGLAGPSRDMLIKKAAPPGATGRVYGTVYSGLDTGFAVAAPIFGALMDRHWNNAVFLGAALALLAGIGAASLVRKA